jgi:hypothetical protein
MLGDSVMPGRSHREGARQLGSRSAAVNRSTIAGAQIVTPPAFEIHDIIVISSGPTTAAPRRRCRSTP